MIEARAGLWPHRARSSALLQSQTAGALLWWHFALFVPTIAFKYLFVRRLSFTAGLRTIVESMGSGVERYVNLLLLVTVDILEVTVIVGGLFVVGRLLLRLPVKWLMFMSVFSFLIIMWANQYSLLLVASLLTVDTFVITTNWVVEHPQVFWQSLGWSQVAFLLLVIVWSSFFAILPTGLTQFQRLLLPFNHSYAFLLKAVLMGSVLGCLAMSRMSASFPLVLRGYWSSTFVSFFKLNAPNSVGTTLPPLASIQADYKRLVYPRGVAPEPGWLADVPMDTRVPRHILIVVLETAPRKYYPLTDNPALPVFREMSKHAITSRHHYAMSPYTWWNNASIISGNYFVQKGKGIFDYGEFNSDSLASILGKHGYTSTFVDSFKLGWARTTGFWKNLGFDELYDSENDPVPFDRSSYSVVVDKERQSFARAVAAITHAESRKSKALVMLGTSIGHYPWLARPGTKTRKSEETLFNIAALFDDLLGEFLKTLSTLGLSDQVLIVVTGDHGFRMRTEFESVGLKAEHGDVAFNVPFVLYAPALFAREVRLPYLTSHVDIAPTLLALTGTKEDAWLHHGSPMLDERLRHRVTFMMNTNLSPVSGFRWNGCHYTLNDLTGKVEVKESPLDTGAASAAKTLGCDQAAGRLGDEVVRSMLEAANRQFQTAFAFQQTKAHVR